MRRAAALCGFAATLFSLLVPLLGGWARPGYDQRSQYISELGELGAIYGGAVSLLGFLPTGVLVLGFIGGAARFFPQATAVQAALVCFSGVGFAYITAAFARCDPGCPDVGSATQAVHNLLGAVEYLGALFALLLLAWSLRSDEEWRPFAGASLAAAAVVLIGFTGMLLGTGSLRGAWQRLAETAIFGWILAVSLRVLRHEPRLRGRR
jgi:hypothetical protein